MPVINEDTELEVAAKLTLLNGPTIANDQNDENLLPPTTVSKMIAETVEGGIAGDAVSEEKEDFQTGGGKSTSETTEEESQIVKKEVESDTGTEEIEREAVTEEQAESQKTGEGTPATEIVEEVAKTGTEETASEAVTEEQEESQKTGEGTSATTETAEEVAETGTEETASEAVTEEQEESQKTGEGTSATEIVEEVAKTGTEETASETVTEEKEETETGGGKYTSEIVEEVAKTGTEAAGSETVTEEQADSQTGEGTPATTETAEEVAETGTEETASETVTEEQADSQTGEGTSATTETAEEVAETGTEETASETVTEEKEETETGGGKSTSETTVEAEIQAANKKISEEAKHPTVKITVSKQVAFEFGDTPQEADIEFESPPNISDLTFKFKSASSINFLGEVTIAYEISYAVEGKTPKGVTSKKGSQSVTHSPSKKKFKQEEKNLKKQYKDCLSEVFTNKDKVLALKESSQAVNEGTVYALTFSNISTKLADEKGSIVLPCTLWKSRANGMFKRNKDLQDCFSISSDPESRRMGTEVQFVLNIKKRDAIDKIEELKKFFNNEIYQLKKIESSVDFISLNDKKSSSAVPKQRQVKKEDLKNKKFLLKELTYTDNSRYLEIKDDKFFWRFGYSEASEWFSVISSAICSESAYIAEQYQEMEWKLTNNDGNKEQIKVSSKGGSLIMVGSNGCWTGWKEKALLLTSPSSCWIKRNEQFELKADISWSATEQGQLVLKSESEPKDWGDKNSFWFMKVNQRLDEWDGKSDLSQSVIDEVHLVPPQKD